MAMNDQPSPDRPDTARNPVADGAMLTAGVVVILAIYAMVNYLALRHYERFDWTSAGLYTLSEKSEKIVADLDRDIDLVVLLDPASAVYPAIDELVDRYVAANPERIARRDLDAAKDLLELQQLVDRYGLNRDNVIVVASEDDQRVIGEYDLATYDYSGGAMGQPPALDEFVGERKITSAILSLVEAEKPKIVFTSGHGEVPGTPAGDLRSFSRARELLGEDNFEIETWSSLGAESVPEGTDLLVIAGPTTNFLEPELALFDAYLEADGRMLVFADPSFAPGGGTELADLGLGPWLARHGVALGDNLVIDPSSDLPFFGPETIFTDRYGSHPIVESLAQTGTRALFPLARSVGPGDAPDGVEVTELVLTSDRAWAETSLADLSAVEEDGDDLPGPISLAVVVTRGEPLDEDDATDTTDAGARLAVFGDVDFATDAQLDNGANGVLLLNTLNWLVERDALVEIEGRAPEKTRLALAEGELFTLQVLLVVGLPGLALVAGIWIALRRRR